MYTTSQVAQYFVHFDLLLKFLQETLPASKWLFWFNLKTTTTTKIEPIDTMNSPDKPFQAHPHIIIQVDNITLNVTISVQI